MNISGNKKFAELLAKAKASPWWRLETALISGAVVIGMASAALSEYNRSLSEQELAEKYRVGMIYVASKQLPRGSVVDSNNFKRAPMLMGGVTRNMVDAAAFVDISGKRLAVDIEAGDPLLMSTVEGLSGNTIASKIPAGRRLFTLQISDKVAGNGWVKPNDHVDVVVTMDLPSRGRTTFTMLQDVTLVSVGKATVWDSGVSSQGSEIGFYVTPDELEFLRFAQDKGQFSLALRNPAETGGKEVARAELGRIGMDMNKFLDNSRISKASGGGDLNVTVDGQDTAKTQK